MSDFTTALRQLLHSPGFKFFLIGFLILLLLIPLFLVMGLISEREGRAQSVKRDVARTWGGEQRLSGPYLVVPYTQMVTTQRGKEQVDRKQERFAVFLPEDLNITAATKAKVLSRSIFNVNVYTADLALTGRFDKPNIRAVAADAMDVRWSDTFIALTLSDVSGLKKSVSIEVDGQRSLKFEPSVGLPAGRQSGFHARLFELSTDAAVGGGTKEPPDAFEFKINLVLSGAEDLFVAPAGRLTKTRITSDWPHPSFSGGFAPATRKISDTGFDATWQVPHLARSIPQSYTVQSGNVDRFAPHYYGVRFYAPVDFYDLVSRAAKYAILFLSLAFMAVFVMELIAGKRIHAVQYFFVGLAMIFFYVLLLSFSEHIGFPLAYAIAAVATGTMLAVYFSKAFQSARYGIAAALLFIVIYGLLYMILQLEDYALLTGAVLGFAALTCVMFATLRVDWRAARADASST